MKTSLTFHIKSPERAASLATAAYMLCRDNDPSYSPDVVCHVIRTILDSARVDADLPQSAIDAIAEDCYRFIALTRKDKPTQ